MLSAIFRGNSMIFGATAASMVAGGTVGALFIYGYQQEATNNEYWNEWWSSYRRRFGEDPSLSASRSTAAKESILRQNDYEYLKLITPRLPRLTCPAQVKSMRFFVPLCGATEDMEVINDFVARLDINRAHHLIIQWIQLMISRLSMLRDPASMDSIE